MAIASITAAWTQFDNNISAYWSSASKALALLEAIDYLIAHGAQAFAVAGRSQTNFDLFRLREQVYPHAVGLNPGANDVMATRGTRNQW